MRDFKDLAQLSDYIQQLEHENEDLLKQVAMLTSEVEHYEEPFR
ncbi:MULTISPECIES: hypothetical protein [unclassified Paenibacillus]